MSFNKRAYIISALRKASYRWQPRGEALKAARIGRNQYTCAHCKGIFGRKEIQLDHIIPIVDPTIGFTTWDEYIERLFCPAENFQVLCKKDHKEKTAFERSLKKNKVDKHKK